MPTSSSASLFDYAEPERWAELEASDNVFALVVMAQIRAKVTDDAETVKRWKPNSAKNSMPTRSNTKCLMSRLMNERGLTPTKSSRCQKATTPDRA
ncbi:hypothetical protein Thiofri_00940 [Thiorhodovibrio frisius]|nr:hypothetical protein Thiofri_00940 [Thiorhodovibrio frisius]